MKNNVIIRKQTFRIRTDSEQLALQVRQQVSDTLQYELLDVYDQVFNSLAFEKTDNIVINKIPLNIGVCSQEELEEKLPRLVKAALIHYLHHPASGDEILPYNSDDTTHASTDIKAVLLYYLEHGIYPWWFKDALYKKPAAIVNGINSETLPVLLKQIIALQINKTPATAAVIRQRFIQLLSDNRMRNVLDVLIGLQEYEVDKTSMQTWTRPATMHGIALLFTTTEMDVQKNWVDLLLKNETVSKETLAIGFFKQLIDRHGIIQPTIKATEIPADLFTALKTVIESAIDFKPEPLIKRRSGLSKETAELAFEGIYIINAGLVILHPFLQQLFTALGLLDQTHHFKNEAAACKATVVLNYLQNNSVAYEEHLMAFNKMLCGLNIEHVIPDGIELAANDKHECNELVKTVIQYWDALKGASAGALRETFFKRSGKLSFKNTHWLLQVERQTADVLIERIPWSISSVKLPWLQHILYTEW
jgi:hypothetical protein